MTPRTISHYEIGSKLGAGGMGEVFRAYDPKLRRHVAIKVLPASVADDMEYVSRFQREAQMLASVNHPNIATVYGLEGHAIIMELVEGETLAARLENRPLPLPLIVRFGIDIATALAAAHGNGIIHRDLKPSNVMVTKTGVKVLDFGLAKATTQADETMTVSRAIMGTPAYMAPEQLEGRTADARTDIFALGLLLYEMATGKRARPADASLGSLKPALARVIENCLHADADKRWQSAADVGIALSGVLAQESSAAKTTQPTRGIKAIEAQESYPLQPARLRCGSTGRAWSSATPWNCT